MASGFFEKDLLLESNILFFNFLILFWETSTDISTDCMFVEL